MSAHDLFTLDLPDDDPSSSGEVVPFPSSAPPARTGGEEEPQQAAWSGWLQPVAERLSAGWRAAWVGDGVFGMRPRPVADLARQFWTSPPPYIRDALVLRIPYAIYGTPVIVLAATAHLLLLIIGYPSLLAATGLLALFLSLFM